MTRLNRFKLLLISTVASVGLIAMPAQAATGNMTFPGEFGKVYLNELKSANGPTNVEDMCGCTGNVLAQWTANGYDHQDVRYFSNETSFGNYNSTIIRYRTGVGLATWQARAKEYCQGLASSWGDPDCTVYNMPTS